MARGDRVGPATGHLGGQGQHRRTRPGWRMPA